MSSKDTWTFVYGKLEPLLSNVAWDVVANAFVNLYWYIKPQKYYLFNAVDNKDLLYREIVSNYKDIIFEK